MDALRQRGYTAPLTVNSFLSGWQMCNLSTVSGRFATSPREFYRGCAMAAAIGTLQAAYTEFPYLGPVSEMITEQEALIGVSICGILDNPDVLLQESVLETGAKLVRTVNAEIAKALGINPAARTTAVKPEGTASAVLGTGSGIHPHHAPRYFRRVQAAKTDPVFRYLAAANPSLIEDSVYDANGKTAVITFAVEGPANAIYRDDLSGVDLLDHVHFVQSHWVNNGSAREEHSPALTHNVSNTCTVRDDEWLAVGNRIWRGRRVYGGVSLLPHTGDKVYAQAPREAVSTADDLARWEEIRRTFVPVDYAGLQEVVDETSLRMSIACGGGSCEII